MRTKRATAEEILTTLENGNISDFKVWVKTANKKQLLNLIVLKLGNETESCLSFQAWLKQLRRIIAE